MKSIHLILSIVVALLTGACDAQQDPYYGNSEVKIPQIDPDWNLKLIPNRSGQYWKVFVYKDLKYNALFTRSLGWNGGDGVFTTGLPDGNIFWSFNDSFYGVVNENRSRGNCSFPRNSIMVQTSGEKDENLVWLADYVQTNDPNADRYYQVRTHIRHPKATLSEDKIQAGEIDQDYLYWAGDATIYNNQMQMLWGAVDNTDENNLMRRFGTCLVTYSLEGKPGDDTYMKLISRNDDFNDHTLGYGDTMWEDEDGHTYLYTTSNYKVPVARTATHDLSSQWEYYVADPQGNFSWTTEYPSTQDAEYSTIIPLESGCSMPWVFKKGDTYYMIGQSIWFGRDVLMFRSKHPYGPFVDQKTLFTLPEFLDKIGEQRYQHVYMVNIHPALSRTGELVFSTNTDCSSFWDNFNAPGSADFYRPYFYRVFNWESVYDNDAPLE